ncbi:MAG: hypothetical protein ACLFQQ_19940 [Desulfococcaceae bacterium]
MPNTLVHIGIHLPITRGIFRRADPKWILLGCVVPDLPWIFQRAARVFLPGANPVDLRLYATVQASLFFCLFFSAGAALLSRRPLRNFAILALGSALHLFLDALQIKWGNGVHFFAPFSWRMTQFGLFWPESPATGFFTFLGMGVLGAFGFRRTDEDAPIRRMANLPTAWTLAGFLLAGYLLLPPALLSGPERANNHYAATLRDKENRIGKPIQLDRVRWEPETGIHVFSGDALKADGLEGAPAGTVSIQGRFVSRNRIEVRRWKRHPAGLRNLASYIGLSGIALAWGWAGFRRFRAERSNGE